MEGSLQAASTVIGTPYYMSPEVCQNQPYAYQSDVWALGCILYEMCALQQATHYTRLYYTILPLIIMLPLGYILYEMCALLQVYY